MWVKSFIGAVWLVVLTSASTSAFELTPAGPNVQTGSGLVSAPPSADDTANSTDDEKSQSAVVPGLGSIGLIPKLDFGLELLYSGDESASGAPTTDSPDDGVVVRGALKQSF